MNATKPQAPVRILTVCLGNHCRSPLAEAVLKALGADRVDVRSAGTRDKWAGGPAHAQMIAAARTAGYDLSGHRGTHISTELIAWADHILAMDRANLEALQAITAPDHQEKLALFLGGQEVPDPFGGSDQAFADCTALIEDGARKVLERL